MCLRKNFLIAGFALSLIASSSAPSVAASEKHCNWYATKALKAYAKSKKYDCGYSGPMWHGWWEGHNSWSLANEKSVVKWGHNARQSKLSICLAQGEN